MASTSTPSFPFATSLLSFSLLLLMVVSASSFLLHPPSSIAPPVQQHRPTRDRSSTLLFMNIFDKLKNSFLDSREGDFVKLEQTADAFGPGPLLVLFNVPAGVTNEEIQDMVQDGAPQAHAKGVALYRVDESNTGNAKEDAAVLDKPMKDALQGMASGAFQDQYNNDEQQSSFTLPNTVGIPPPIVVTFFSGFSNQEMLATYNILGGEIYQEAQLSPACAKAVPNAMDKPLRQVLEEIGGDHRESMAMLEQQQQNGGNEQ